MDQLLFHLNVPGRVDALSPAQASALLDALWVLADTHAEEITPCDDWYRMEEAMQRLERATTRDGV